MRSNRVVGTLCVSFLLKFVNMDIATRLQRLKQNPRWLFWGRALYETKILNAIIALFYVHRGLTLREIFWLAIVWAVVALLTEVPTGYIGDRIGRKNSLLVGFWLFVFSTLLLIFAHGFWMVALTMGISSLSFAFISGTDEALLYDTLKEIGEEKHATKYNSQYFAARNLFKMVIPVIGAFVAKDLAQWQFTVLLIADALLTILGIWFIHKLIEPQPFHSLAREERAVMRDSFITLWKDPWLIRMGFSKALGFMGIFAFWRIYQLILEEHGVSVVWLGIFYIFFHGSAFLMRNMIPVLEAKFGTVTLANVSAGLPILALLPLFFVTNPIILYILAYCVLLPGVVREPLFMSLMNHGIASHHRATTLSKLNALRNLIDIPVYLVGGMLAMRYGSLAGVGISVTLLLLAATVFAVRPIDVQRRGAVVH